MKHASGLLRFEVPGTHVLVVDDDQNMRDLVALHLRNAGYEVELAQDAVVAARRILNRVPGLLIVDVEMPHWNGLDFAATVRADSMIPVLPILMMTAHEGYAIRARAVGLDCLLKPFIKDDLLAIVAQNLKAHPDMEVSAQLRRPTPLRLAAA